MTKEIEFQVAGLEHLTKQPFEARYALFCAPASRGEYGLTCESKRRGGHLGDFRTSVEAIENGIAHPHPIIIRFYQLEGRQKPDWKK